VPVGWAGRPVYLHVEITPAGATGFSGEALACDSAGRALQGVTPNHPDVLLTTSAQDGEQLECYLEAAANPLRRSNFCDWPLLDPEPDGPPLYSISCHLVTLEEEVLDLVADLRVLAGLLEGDGLDPARAGQVRAALGAACDAVDLAGVPQGLKAARAALEEALSRPAVPSAHRVVACGHSHIDSAWLWPLREGRRKCLRTFATVVSLIESFPDFVFAASSAQHFAWVQQDDPELFERVREKVKAGRFVPVGGFWVECDVNIPLGESLVRQLLFGVRYFEKELGVRVEEAWLPDAFGYSASLPQLLRQAGLRYFLTQKLSTNERDRFPHSSFLWEGIDGSSVFAHFPPTETYSGTMAPGELAWGVQVFGQHEEASRSLYLFGHGDGGGGPTPGMIEEARRLGDLEGLPRVEIGDPRDFFRAASEELADPPVWSGELYYERHRGTYTSQAATKTGIRRAELALRRAEAWSCLAPGTPDGEPGPDFENAWKTLLLNEFHDIAPGSSLNWVHRQATAELSEVAAGAEAVTAQALDRLATAVGTEACVHPVVVFNSQGHNRVDVVTLSAELLGPGAEASVAPLEAVGPDEIPWPVQRLADGNLAFVAQIPSFGYARYNLRPAGRTGATALSGWVEVGPRRLENEALRVELDDDGLLVSVFDKRARREILSGRGNLLQIFPDYPVNNDAWDIDPTALCQPEDLTALDEMVVEEHGPVRATIRLTRRFASSAITQRLSLSSTSAWVDVRNEVDWHEQHRLLKVAFPLAVRCSQARYEVAFGLVERPTHRNTSWDEARFEVCAHRFADLSEPGYGVALANDCKYGYDVAGNVVRLSLLRGPTAPDPLADQGSHRFAYRLIPHTGELGPGGVVEAAHDLNDPLWPVTTTAHVGEAPPIASLLAAEPSSVVIDTVKRAEEGGEIVVRCYEAWGGRGRARLRLPDKAVRAVRADILEAGTTELPLGPDGAVEVELGPFEVVTVKAAVAPATGAARGRVC
jgi:alpha-mannosidase